ncbi:hypothetical protein HNY73_012189 [Argiope bruennichi]|uniref:Uncharacterized protein n=1 Tax=Argiope bruennichi TaxID=94029 RepID=A0A8T0EW72_ARGBR|nr:hypothetical protein HNY73_012189 [Argiope bruennichi]
MGYCMLRLCRTFCLPKLGTGRSVKSVRYGVNLVVMKRSMIRIMKGEHAVSAKDLCPLKSGDFRDRTVDVVQQPPANPSHLAIVCLIDASVRCLSSIMAYFGVVPKVTPGIRIVIRMSSRARTPSRNGSEGMFSLVASLQRDMLIRRDGTWLLG